MFYTVKLYRIYVQKFEVARNLRNFFRTKEGLIRNRLFSPKSILCAFLHTSCRSEIVRTV